MAKDPERELPQAVEVARRELERASAFTVAYGTTPEPHVIDYAERLAQASLTLLAVVSDQTPRWVAERLVKNALQDEQWNARLDELRIRGFSVPGGFQTVYWAAHVRLS